MVDPENWSLPEEFTRVLKEHMGSVPTFFYVPWPPTMLPAINAELTFSGVPTTNDRCVVDSIDFDYMKEEGVTAYIVTRNKWKPKSMTPYVLHKFAKEGFLLEDMTSLHEVLEESGLWTQLE